MGRRIFTDAQSEVLREIAAKTLKRYKSQEEMALALGMTQSSLSSLLSGKWSPGLTTARNIANLAGVTLEDLFPDDLPAVLALAPSPPPRAAFARSQYPNLDTCIRFYDGVKSWAPWTIAAARAGYFGAEDVAPPAWADRLDALEKRIGKGHG